MELKKETIEAGEVLKGVLAKLLEKEWIYDHRNSLTDEILYSISDSGTLAMVAL